MLQVTYEATTRLEPGRLARIGEDRGRIHVEVDKTEPLPDVIRQLNIEMADFLSRADWFQLWDSEIMSRYTPEHRFRVDFVLLPDEALLLMPDAAHGLCIAEDRGVVTIYIGADMTTEQFAASMNPAVRGFLDGGCWFQLYGGEIIDHSPEVMSRV